MTALPPCPLCGGAERRVIASQRLLDPAAAGPAPGGDLNERTVDYAACAACGTVSMHPPPSQELLDGYYQGEPLESNDARQAAAMEALTAARMAVLRQVTGLAGGHALEVGAGPGRLLDALGGSLHMKAVGLEPSTGFPARDDVLRVPLEAFDAGAAGWPEVYDLVVSCNVLEHVVDAAGFLDRLTSRVRTDGWLLLEVPSSERLARGEPCAFGQNIYPLHLHHFTAGGLHDALRRRGLEIVYCSDHATGAYPSLLLAARRRAADGPARRFLRQYGHQTAASREAADRLARLAAEGPVLVWGAGVDLFEVLVALPDGLPANVDLYDRNPAKQGRRLAGVPILSDDGLRERRYRTVLAGSRHPHLGAAILADARATFPDAVHDWLIPPRTGA